MRHVLSTMRAQHHGITGSFHHGQGHGCRHRLVVLRVLNLMCHRVVSQPMGTHQERGSGVGSIPACKGYITNYGGI